MFERFTERARQVVGLAQEEARLHQRGYIGVEHILLGLIREEEGIGSRVLIGLGVTADAVRDSIKLRVDTGVDKVEGQVPFTPRAKKALELALREALGLGHNYIGTEHVLLGILREGDNTALEILHDDFDLTDEQIRNEVIRMLSGKAAPILTKGVDSHPFQAGQEETEFKLFTKEEVVQRRQVQEVQSKLDELKKQSELRDLLVDAANLARQYPDRDPQRIAAAVLAMS